MIKKIFLIILSFFGVYILQAQVTTNGGSGLSLNYLSLSDAISALNNATIFSPVIINVSANQSAPAGGYIITAQGTAANTITFSGKGIIITASNAQSPGSHTDGIFKLIGADYITISEFSLKENTANNILDSTTNNMTEWGIALLTASGSNGSQNIQIIGDTISLNKFYANSFGVYASTAHTDGNAFAVADISAATGGHDNLKIYSNTISNVNIAIAAIGSPEFPGTGLEVGGPSAAYGNTLIDWGTTTSYPAMARVENKVAAINEKIFVPVVSGILAVNQIAPTIAYNIINSATGGNNEGGLLQGIYMTANGPLTYPVAGTTTSVSNNTFSLSSGYAGTASAPLIGGIRVATGDLNNTLNILGNNFTSINHIIPNAAGSDTLIYVLASTHHLSINNNLFSNLSIGNKGNITLIAIGGRVFMPVNGTQNVNGNSISGNFNRTATSAPGQLTAIAKLTITGAVATDGSEAGSIFTAKDNNFSNITTHGGVFTGISNFDGKVGMPTLAKVLNNNIFSNINTSPVKISEIEGGGINLFLFTNRGGVHHISNNQIHNITTIGTEISGNFSGISINSVMPGMSATVTRNIFKNITGGTLVGVNLPMPLLTVSHNAFIDFHGRSSVFGGAGVTALYLSSFISGSNITINHNVIGNLDNIREGTVTGIQLGGASAENNITAEIHNNLIGSLTAPIATNINAITGLLFNSGSITANVTYNTIYLKATSSSTTSFGSSCILFNSSNTSINLRNNILMNLSTPAQEGLNMGSNGVSAALRRSGLGELSVAPPNYNLSSNNNLFFVNPTAGTQNHATYLEGGIVGSIPINNSQNSFEDMKAFMGNRDQASVTENSANNPFISLDAGVAGYLRVNPIFIFAGSNAGIPVPAILNDIDEDTRSLTPDIGADEYNTDPNAVPLPVTFFLLNGNKSGTDNVLSWVTTAEINNLKFVIERSINGTAFVQIGAVASKARSGNSNIPLSYSFKDDKAAKGNLYYRVAQTDIDGSSKHSNVVMIAEKLTQAGIISNLYPNPAKGSVSMEVNATKNQNAIFTVTAISGRVIMQQTSIIMKGTNTINLNLNTLNGGIYYITIQMDQMEKPEKIKIFKL